MEDSIGSFRVLPQQRDGTGGWQRHEFHAAPLGFSLQLRDKRESALCSGPDHETTAVPGDLLRERPRRVTIRGAELSGRLLVALSDNAPVEHHVVVVGLAVDLDLAECETLEVHHL